MRMMRRARRQISAEAVNWLLQFQGGDAEPNRRSFSEWLLRSPLHVEEYLRVSRACCLLNVGAEGDFEAGTLVAAAKRHHEADNVVHLPSGFGRVSLRASSEYDRGLSGRHRRLALAASLVLGVALWFTYLSWHSPMTFQTMIGEQRSLTLQDGSVVFLNTDSKVQVGWFPTERHIDLVRGEARFKVAKDAHRPFIVATARAAVRAVGTVFNVRAEPLSTQVAVLEGQVEVTVAPARDLASAAQVSANEGAGDPSRSGVERVRLAAGERAAVTSHGIQTGSGPPIESVVAWTERRLVFRDQPLDTVIQEFNRYRLQPLVLDDRALADLRISGVFDLSDPESLIVYLATYEAVQVDRRSDGSQHLSRGPAPLDAAK